VCVASFIIFAAAARAQENVQKQLLSQERKLIDAINTRDDAVLRELLAEETLSITPSRGRQSNKQLVGGLEKLSFNDYKISDVKTIVLNPDVALLTYNFSYAVGEKDERAERSNVYATSVWKRKNGKWRSVFYQETPRTAR
jgi:uncharacterized protein (TIGR02246 family)